MSVVCINFHIEMCFKDTEAVLMMQANDLSQMVSRSSRTIFLITFIRCMPLSISIDVVNKQGHALKRQGWALKCEIRSMNV